MTGGRIVIGGVRPGDRMWAPAHVVERCQREWDAPVPGEVTR